MFRVIDLYKDEMSSRSSDNKRQGIHFYRYVIGTGTFAHRRNTTGLRQGDGREPGVPSEYHATTTASRIAQPLP